MRERIRPMGKTLLLQGAPFVFRMGQVTLGVSTFHSMFVFIMLGLVR